MEQSPSITKLATALGLFQSKIHTVAFDSSVSVQPQGKTGYSFKYASMSTILAAVRPVLHENKLSVSQLIEIDGGVTTILMHESGEFLKSTLKMPVDMTGGKNDIQKIGSAITYARRYAIAGILCLATDDDDDGNIASDNEIKNKSEVKPQAATQFKSSSNNSLPWITLPQVEILEHQMWLGKIIDFEDVSNKLRMSKVNLEKLNSTLAQVRKSPPAPLTEVQKEWLKSAGDMNTEEELKKYWDQCDECHTDPTFKRIINKRKLEISLIPKK